ncbi:MAG: TlpA disulfide reductase family protein [Candidatus Competibacteraceae bacterium]
MKGKHILWRITKGRSIVNFWATWCPPCVKEMLSLQRAWEQLRQEDIQVLAINMGQDREDIAYFLEISGGIRDFAGLRCRRR